MQLFLKIILSIKYNCNYNNERSLEVEELLNKAILGDKNAFSLIFLQLQNDLYRIALSKTKNKEDALDAIQETMIITYKNLNNLNSQSPICKLHITKIWVNAAKVAL